MTENTTLIKGTFGTKSFSHANNRYQTTKKYSITDKYRQIQEQMNTDMKLNLINSPKGQFVFNNLGVTAKKKMNIRSVKVRSPVYG